MISYIKTLPGNENTNIEEESKMERMLEEDREDRKAIELKAVRNKKLSKCITDERTAKLNNQMQQLYQKDAEIVNNGHKMLDKLIEKIDKFKTDRDNLPKDADGIYLVVEGRAKIVNRLKGYDFKGQSIVKGDFFGESKFIKSFGFSYFGDILACKLEDPSEDSKTKLSKKGAAKQNTRRSTEKRVDDIE